VNWIAWVLLVLIPCSAYMGALTGQRIERGRREAVADQREEAAHARGIRGTVRLSTMKIRR
jgi:hypothetical protein